MNFVFLANPSNPTGKALSALETQVIRSQAGKVLIDETYVDYSASSQAELAFGENRLVFRSFSKSYGLAGLRLGVVFWRTQPHCRHEGQTVVLQCGRA